MELAALDDSHAENAPPGPSVPAVAGTVVISETRELIEFLNQRREIVHLKIVGDPQ